MQALDVVEVAEEFDLPHPQLTSYYGTLCDELENTIVKTLGTCLAGVPRVEESLDGTQLIGATQTEFDALLGEVVVTVKHW
jgi:hypothetical protein